MLWQWLPARNHLPPCYILLKDRMELSHPQKSSPPTLAQSLCESKVQFVVEDICPFRQIASGQNGRLNPLRTGITTEAGALFDSHPRSKNRRFYQTSPLLTLPSALICRLQRTIQKNTSPTKSSEETISVRVCSPLPTPSSLSLCRRVVRLAQTCMPSLVHHQMGG